MLHDFKLGPWKDVLTHIARILESLGPEKVRAFNERCVPCWPLVACVGFLTVTPTSFRQVPAFGETTIRRFESDVSEMKRLTGHELEDLLQVS